MSGRVVLLGPQRPTPNLVAVLRHLQGEARAEGAGGPPEDGRVVFITAGWRHDEAENAALRRDFDPDAVSIPLYFAFDVVAGRWPDLGRGYKERQSRIRKAKALYRIRLHPALAVVRRLFARLDEDPDLVRPVLDAAVGTVRDIDQHFLLHSDAVHAEFEQRFRPAENPDIARIRDRAEEVLSEARVVIVAGGHVGVLRNRLEFFGMDELLCRTLARGVPLVAWSAGAMALAERVVLFHDDPPHGVGDPELLDRGLGVLADAVFFPHARQRLRLDDPARVAALATRFAPQDCLGLEPGAWLCRSSGAWQNLGPEDSAFRFGVDGATHPLDGGEGGPDAADP